MASFTLSWPAFEKVSGIMHHKTALKQTKIQEVYMLEMKTRFVV